MPLYEIVKADGTREKVEAAMSNVHGGQLTLVQHDGLRSSPITYVHYAPGTWLEVWRREGVGE